MFVFNNRQVKIDAIKVMLNDEYDKIKVQVKITE